MNEIKFQASMIMLNGVRVGMIVQETRTRWVASCGRTGVVVVGEGKKKTAEAFVEKWLAKK